MTENDFHMNGNTASSIGNVFSLTKSVIQSKEIYRRPLVVEAEMRSTQHSECIAMTLFASGNGKNDEISLEIGSWGTKWRIFPNDNHGDIGSVVDFRKVKIEVNAENTVKFFIDGTLRYTTTSSKSSGYLRFPKVTLDHLNIYFFLLRRV